MADYIVREAVIADSRGLHSAVCMPIVYLTKQHQITDAELQCNGNRANPNSPWQLLSLIGLPNATITIRVPQGKDRDLYDTTVVRIIEDSKISSRSDVELYSLYGIDMSIPRSII